jgi:hypothetical protein
MYSDFTCGPILISFRSWWHLLNTCLYLKVSSDLLDSPSSGIGFSILVTFFVGGFLKTFLVLVGTLDGG